MAFMRLLESLCTLVVLFLQYPALTAAESSSSLFLKVGVPIFVILILAIGGVILFIVLKDRQKAKTSPEEGADKQKGDFDNTKKGDGNSISDSKLSIESVKQNSATHGAKGNDGEAEQLPNVASDD